MTVPARLALSGNRVEWFRYELHRKVGGVWTLIDDDLQGVRDCLIGQDRRARIKRSGSFRIVDDGNVDFTSDVVRVFWNFRAAEVGSTTHTFCMGTFYMNTPTRPLLKSGNIRSVTAYDALVVLDGWKLTEWLVIPVGDHVVQTVVNLLNNAFPAAGVVMPRTEDKIGDNETNPTPKVFEVGMSLLDVCNRLLAYVNYNSIRADVFGNFVSEAYVLPANRPAEFILSDQEPLFNHMIGDASVLNFDVFDAPNRFVLTCGRPGEPAPYPLLSEYNVPTGPFSAAARNGMVFTRHESVDVISQAKLDELVKVFAAEELMDRHTLGIKTPLLPSDWADCVVIGPYQRLPPSEPQHMNYIERSWTFPCMPGGVMEHVYAPVYETT